jgi:ceramide glucosyltransferase
MDLIRWEYLPTGMAVAIHLLIMGSLCWAMLRHRRRPPAVIDLAARVSLLKPLAGADDELAKNLSSFAAIDYPSFEILLGVASTSDPAFSAAQAFVREHPKVDARIVITDSSAALNPKISQLVALDRQATGSIVVISDSNVRVAPSYLFSMVRELSVEGTGLVTSVFAGKGETTLGAALENLQLGVAVAPGVIASAVLSPRPLTVVKSMGMRRRDLVRLGGFRSLGNYLAEDHVLGRRFIEAGFRVRTSLDPVDNYNVACSVRRTLERHARWAKMRRVISPFAFLFEPFLSPLTIATLTALMVPSRATLALVMATAILQVMTAFVALRILRGNALAWYYAPLEIVRTGLVFWCWARALLSRRVSWRGHAFTLARDTVIVPLEAGPWAQRRHSWR